MLFMQWGQNATAQTQSQLLRTESTAHLHVRDKGHSFHEASSCFGQKVMVWKRSKISHVCQSGKTITDHGGFPPRTWRSASLSCIMMHHEYCPERKAIATHYTNIRDSLQSLIWITENIHQQNGIMCTCMAVSCLAIILVLIIKWSIIRLHLQICCAAFHPFMHRCLAAITTDNCCITTYPLMSCLSLSVNVRHHKFRTFFLKKNYHWTRGHKGKCSSLLFYYK